MRKVIRLVILCLLLTALVSCTENSKAKSFGGTMTIDVPAGYKVENITWKKEDLWYSYRPMREDEKPEKHIFVEKSSFGLLQGKIIFAERVEGDTTKKP